MFTTEVAGVLGVISTIVVTILIYVKIMPRHLDGTFDNGLYQWLHDLFHFKKLYIEEVLRFVYVLATVVCVCGGIFMMVSYTEYRSYDYYMERMVTRREGYFLPGLLVTVFGPIALRLAYEVVMMGIMLVKNVIDINNKLSNKAEKTQEDMQEVTKTYVKQQPVFSDSVRDYGEMPASNGQFAAAAKSDCWVCDGCGTENSNNYGACKKCGKYRDS